jgi:hypothetical protein
MALFAQTVLSLPRVAHVLLVLALLFLPFDAQAQNMPWVKQFGTNRVDSGNAVAYGEFGMYVAGDTIGTLPGQTRASENNKDAFLALYD